jgi:hypothetical protein
MSNDTVLKPRLSEISQGAACVSRRQLFGQVAAAASGAAVLVATAIPAEAKMTQTGSGYQDSPKGSDSCANCTLFKPPSSCILVDGTISPTGWCRFYAKKS